MKKLVLFSAFAVAIAFSACNKNTEEKTTEAAPVEETVVVEEVVVEDVPADSTVVAE